MLYKMVVLNPNRSEIHMSCGSLVRIGQMSRILFVLNLLAIFGTAHGAFLRVMTFNTWLSGKRVQNGLQKIAKHISQLQPDIVALQEIASPDVVHNLTSLLGASVWKAALVPGVSHPDTVIITRHKFVRNRPFLAFFAPNREDPENGVPNLYGVGASIELTTHRRRVRPRSQGRRVLNFFSMHLDYTSYGPYAANNKKVTRKEQIMAGERNRGGWGRAQNIEQLLADGQFRKFVQKTEVEPLIVAGDFNCPSHQDWGEETRHLHGGWVFEWPATKLLTDAGLVDAFRQVHPNVTEIPGNTWSTVWKFDGPEWDWTIEEPQDRIDLVFYKGTQLIRPIAAGPYSGTVTPAPMPDPWHNDWPSDHYATVVDFEWAA